MADTTELTGSFDHIEQHSDAELIAAAAHVIARPRVEPADSFVLHAPLELAARAALLDLVPAQVVPEARARVVELVRHYEAFGLAVDLPDVADTDSAPLGLPAALASGDLVAVDRAARAVAATRPAAGWAADLGDHLLPLTGAAGHAPILLDQLTRATPRCDLSPELLRPLARELGRHPEWRIRWFERATSLGDADPDQVFRALADVPALGEPESTFIHPLMMRIDESGLAERWLAPVAGRSTPDAARQLLRVAARSMLLDDPRHAPYGWTHCLTMPQAVLTVGASGADPDLAFRVALTQVAAFRASLGAEGAAIARDLDHLEALDPVDLAARAAVHHDAHVVKYVVACLDAAADDPEATPLFHHAADHLLRIWNA